MTCEELLPEYDAYALGIAQDAEHEEISRHLNGGCDYCELGIASAHYAMAAMAGRVELAEPPARLRRRVLAVTSRNGDGRGWLAQQLPWAVAAAFAFALLMAVVRPGDDLNGAALKQALPILNDPAALVVSFNQPSFDQASAHGRAIVSPSRGIVFTASRLPKLEAGKTFELWMISAAGKSVSAGTFRGDTNSIAVHVYRRSSNGAAALEVTVEPAGGSARPTTPPLLAVKL